MRKLMMAVMAVAGLGLVTGCERKSEVQEQREDVAQAQRDAAKQNAEAQQDVAEEQRELAEAQQEQTNDQFKREDATGGSGTTANVKTEEVKGTIQSASANNITLIVPDKNNQMMRFQANQQVQVTRDDKPVALTDLKPGDEVRASYQLDPNGQLVLRSIDVTKQSAQHPGKQKK